MLNFTQSSDEMKKTNTLNENKLVKLISEAKKKQQKNNSFPGLFITSPKQIMSSQLMQI